MSGPEQIMSVLLDAEDMRLIHTSWPQDMRLGVCLMPSGDCQLMLFHQDESIGFPERLKDHFGLRASEISIHPKVAGFSTHPMKYSEERALANLLSEHVELTEEAQDYSVNFAFAQEEGLDPLRFMGGSSKPPEMPRLNDEGAPVLTFKSCRAPRHEPIKTRKLHLDLPRAAQDTPKPVAAEKSKHARIQAPADGFTSAAQLSAIDTVPKDFELTRTPAGGIEICATSGLGAKLVVSDARNVFLRDDRKLLALQLPENVLPEQIHILPHAVPSALLQTLSETKEPAEVFAQEGYVYVTLGTNTSEEVAPKPAANPKSMSAKKRWAAFRLVALTALTAAGIYLVLGGSLGTAPQGVAENQIDWDSLRNLL